jgi:hypothetical protein
MTVADFIPKRRVITAITNATNAVVTAATHGYATNEFVRINVPSNYGMRLGNVLARVTVINANTFSINHDTLLMNAFAVPAAPFTSAEAVPLGMTDNIAT